MVDSIAGYLKHFDNPDKDHRYMAVSDLLADIQKHTWRQPASNDDAIRLCDKVVERLNDKSGDISALAVKWCASHASCRVTQASDRIPQNRAATCVHKNFVCLPAVWCVPSSTGALCSLVELSGTVADTHLKRLLTQLCKNLIESREKKGSNEDAACIGLKAIASELPEAKGAVLAQTCMPILLQGLPPQVRF
jgi:hypothetical protein